MAGVICFITGAIFWKFDSPDGPAGRLVAMILRANESYDSGIYLRADLAEVLSRWMAWQWFLAGGLLLLMCALLCWRRWSVRAAYILLGLAIAEVYFAAVLSSQISAIALAFPSQWTLQAERATEADQRVLFSNSFVYGNLANVVGYNSLWGYDPGQPKLYTELIACSQEQTSIPPDRYTFNLLRISRVFRLLRCAYIFRHNAQQPFIKMRDPMPHLQLMNRYVIFKDSHAIDAALVGDFDFMHQVILQDIPSPAPAGKAGKAGQVKLVSQSINNLEIEADLPAAALLFITDAYAPGWHARAVEKNPDQDTYEVLRADSVLRAIPLAAGHHHFVLSYTPPGWWAGIGLSAAGFTALAAGVVRLTLKRS
jgi:hypothetical protein